MNTRSVEIFGKDTWPYTDAARRDYAAQGYRVVYRNVLDSAADMADMLRHSGNRRSVPVIVEDGKVTTGYGGTW